MDPLLKHEGEEFYSVKVNAVGSSAIYTISSSYDSNYPSGLLNLIEPREYERIIDRVNDEILGLVDVIALVCTNCFSVEVIFFVCQ